MTARVREGQSFAAALEARGVFPDVAVKMAEVGESTGALQDMLNTVADFYDEEISTNMERFVTLIEPLLLVIMGIVIAGAAAGAVHAALPVELGADDILMADSRRNRSVPRRAVRAGRRRRAARSRAGAAARRALSARVRRHGHVPDRPRAVPVDSGRSDAALRLRAVPPRGQRAHPGDRRLRPDATCR